MPPVCPSESVVQAKVYHRWRHLPVLLRRAGGMTVGLAVRRQKSEEKTNLGSQDASARLLRVAEFAALQSAPSEPSRAGRMQRFLSRRLRR